MVMAQQLKFQVTAPTGFGTRYIVSRHATLAAAQRAASKGTADFRVEEIAS